MKVLLVNNQSIEPGEEFEYTSGTPLKQLGSYAWKLQNANYNGEEFEVKIPPFLTWIFQIKKII